jgi:hypothetical protein
VAAGPRGVGSDSPSLPWLPVVFREGLRRYLHMMLVVYIAIAGRMQDARFVGRGDHLPGVAVDLEDDLLLELEFHSESHASGVSRGPAV